MYGKPFIYFDNGATTQKPRLVVEAITDEYYSVNANVHRGVHFFPSRLPSCMKLPVKRYVSLSMHAARMKLSLHAERRKVSTCLFPASATSQMEEGDEVIVSVMEHHSNIVPWQLQAARKGIAMKVIPMNDKGELLLDEYEKLFSERTKIVSVVHVSNVLGTVNPVKEMIATAHAHGVPCLIDAAQSIPHMKVDVQELDADFLVFSAIRYMVRQVSEYFMERKNG